MADRSCRRAPGGSSSALIDGRRATCCPRTHRPSRCSCCATRCPGSASSGTSRKGPVLPTCRTAARAARRDSVRLPARRLRSRWNRRSSRATAAASALRGMGLEKSRHDVQISRATIIVDLRPDEDALLASFKPKCRYNIRLAQRHGVTVAPVSLDARKHRHHVLADGVDPRSSRLHAAQQGVLLAGTGTFTPPPVRASCSSRHSTARCSPGSSPRTSAARPGTRTAGRRRSTPP